MAFSDVNYDGSHQMVIVAAELDSSFERIINYQNDKAKTPVNTVCLSLTWMIPLEETQERVISKSAKEPWNSEFYVSFGHGKE